MKYRIVTDGRNFKAQVSKYGFIWTDIKRFTSKNMYRTVQDSEEEAEKAIEQYKRTIEDSNIFAKKKWRVIKEFA